MRTVLLAGLLGATIVGPAQGQYGDISDVKIAKPEDAGTDHVAGPREPGPVPQHLVGAREVGAGQAASGDKWGCKSLSSR